MNNESHSDAYRNSGVDITRGYKAVELIKRHADATRIPGCLSGLGDFSGLFELDGSFGHPVLVSGTDGVGTKLKIAFLMDKHDTVGIDCVAMCVNDVVCSGARPLFFLDYIALGKLDPYKVESIVKGVAKGCRLSGCALVGGETAEMPGFYPEDEYDLAGFSVGIAEKEKLFDRNGVQAGDAVIAFPSSGIHSNGFSLVRKVFSLDENPSSLERRYDCLDGKSLGEALLTPTRIYVRDLLSLDGKVTVKAAAHITGGGFQENMPRCLPEGKRIRIDMRDVRTPEIFRLIAKEGDIPQRDMFNTFNMGVGMIVIVAPEHAAAVVSMVPGSYELGEVISGKKGVVLC
ncbi:MAG: phosphoribosylformylglycinamidine cyclo-ligase [Sphaerochaetaceae bacterium]